MGRRDDRLHTPEAFKRVLMSRPVARNGPFLVYRVPLHSLPTEVMSGGPRIGFVIPKKLVRLAVQRNQIKRWARAIFRHPDHTPTESFAMVVRVHQALPAAQWLTQGRALARIELGRAMQQALGPKPAQPL
jgi:ribonuclease P protein component